MKGIVQIIGVALIVSLFFYDKTKKYEDQLDAGYLKYFRICKSLFDPIMVFINRYIKPVKMGNGISIDVSHIIILLILLLIIRL